jgi:hypothetical protein
MKHAIKTENTETASAIGANETQEVTQAQASRPSAYKVFSGDKINAELAKLPIAVLKPVYAYNTETLQYDHLADKAAVYSGVEGSPKEYASVVGGNYGLVQHDPAFRPIIEGLTQAGIKDFRFSLQHWRKGALLNIYVDNPIQEGSGVYLGFSAYNSFCGHHAFTYGFDFSNTGKAQIEVIAWRQVCENGAKIIVDLANAQFVTLEIKSKLDSYLSEVRKLRHTKSIIGKLQEMQYITEAVSLLKVPIESMIKSAGLIEIEDQDKLKKLIKQHVGKRYASKVEEEYNKAGYNNTIWDLFNAITYIASHDEKVTFTGRQLLEEKAAKMLLYEITN